MKKKGIICQLKPYIQPFERSLALKELEILAGETPRKVTVIGERECFRVTSRRCPDVLAHELAFWEVIQDPEPRFTLQTLREATVNVVRNGIPTSEISKQLPFGKNVPLPNRRCLRYGPHGLHEYRGKFFPQLVRALLNISGAAAGEIIADPFCGSGTTAVEAILARRNVVALDMNPLSVFMARTKCNVLRLGFSELERHYTNVRAALLETQKRKVFPSWIARLDEKDQAFLKNWFADAILCELDQIAGCINTVAAREVRDFMMLCLSNILRKVSWQKEDDLRIRRELKPVDEIDPVREFLEELGRSSRLVLAFLRQEQEPVAGDAVITEGDSKSVATHWKMWARKIDAVITSPPYATALPYLDTDRLSLSFLGLLPRNAHREKDQQMIGNREITDKLRRDLWEEFQAGNHKLPGSVSTLISRIHKLNENHSVGFRRRNLPSLLFKYFRDMQEVFVGLIHVLKPGASAFVVVGNNHTVAGGQRVEIETVELLCAVAESAGFKIQEKIAMDMLVSRDIFRNNTIDSESILHLRKGR